MASRFGFDGSNVTASVNTEGGGGGGAAISASGSSVNSGTVVFSNSGGVSFGMNGSTVTATVATNYQSQGAYLTTGQPPGAYLTTAMLSNAGTISNIKVSAGASSSNVSAVTFSNTNGVSFGYDGTNITASVVTSYQPAGAYLTTARASNDAVGTNTALTANGVSWTVNSAGLSLNVPAFLTTAQAPGAYLTTARASNDAIGTNTALTANGVSWTANSAGLSLNVPAFLTTAQAPGAYLTTAMLSNAATISNFKISAGGSSSNVSSVNFANTNGAVVRLRRDEHDGIRGDCLSGQGAYLTTAMFSNAATLSNVNISAGATSANLSNWTYSNANGISFGLTNSVITASIATSLSVINVSAGAASGNLGSVVFSNSNGISFGLNGSTITATPVIESQFDPFAQFGGSVITNSTLGASTLYFQPFDLEHHLNAYRINFFFSIATGTAGSNATWSAGYSAGAALYQPDTGANSTQMTSFWSGSFGISATGSSNTTGVATFPMGISNSTAVSTELRLQYEQLLVMSPVSGWSRSRSVPHSSRAGTSSGSATVLQQQAPRKSSPSMHQWPSTRGPWPTCTGPWARRRRPATPPSLGRSRD